MTVLCYIQRIQFPNSVSTMKYTEQNIPRCTPPWDSIPWYITAFQSSPVRIWRDKIHYGKTNIKWGPSDTYHQAVNTWNTVRIAAGNVSKLVVGVSSSKLNLKERWWAVNHFLGWVSCVCLGASFALIFKIFHFFQFANLAKTAKMELISSNNNVSSAYKSLAQFSSPHLWN